MNETPEFEDLDILDQALLFKKSIEYLESSGFSIHFPKDKQKTVIVISEMLGECLAGKEIIRLKTMKELVHIQAGHWRGVKKRMLEEAQEKS